MLTLLASTVWLAGCNPYMAAVSVVAQSYGVATDERSVATQAKDTEIEGEIQAALIASPVQGIGSLDVTSRQGVVLLAGVMPPGDPAGLTAVKIARSTSGVKRVETFFVAYRPSTASDLEIEGKIKAAFIADPNLEEAQVSSAVYAGHVVLVGVVATPEQAAEFVQDANGVQGVQSVRSYIQLPQ
jgi:hyperosmotically inducible protein